MNGQDKSLIAEIGSVHDGSYGNAMRLIDAAADCGATAVKFQTHIAEAETLHGAPVPKYFSDEPRFEYFERTAFDLEQWKGLKAKAVDRNVRFVSSPFSIEAVELLEEVCVDYYKIASGEVTNIPLLERVADTGKPVLLSSGMASWAELDVAIGALRDGGPLVVMQCTSAYPCPPERVGLNVISAMRERYGLTVGYSDHSMGLAAAFAAAALGATVIEKHFTFSRRMYGSDARHSMEPDEFTVLSQGLREIWGMLENPVDKSDAAVYSDMKLIFEKSVVTARDLKQGHTITREDLAFKKPGDGISAARYRDIIGRCTKTALPRDHQLSSDDFL